MGGCIYPFQMYRNVLVMLRYLRLCLIALRLCFEMASTNTIGLKSCRAIKADEPPQRLRCEASLAANPMFYGFQRFR